MYSWKKRLNKSFEQAAAAGFPVFLHGEMGCTPKNATPYVTSLATFASTIRSWPGRASLLEKLENALIDSLTSGLPAKALLIGGSFLDISIDNPKDLDCIWFCSTAGRDIDPAYITRFQESLKHEGIDARLVSLDHEPLILVNNIAFFSILYSKRRGSLDLARGLVLIDCAELEAPSHER